MYHEHVCRGRARRRFISKHPYAQTNNDPLSPVFFLYTFLFLLSPLFLRPFVPLLLLPAHPPFCKYSMLVPLHLRRQLRTIAWLWGTLSPLAATVSAQQSPPPALVCCMAYTTINEDTFYVQGGTLITGTGASTNASQFYALDLTQPTWNTLNPPWKALVYPANLNALSSTEGHSISVAPDSSSFTMWIYNPNLIVNYNVAGGVWTQVLPTPSLTLFKGNDLQAATDPTSGLVYIPGAAGTYNTMSVYAPSGMGLSVPIPSTLVAATGFYTFVWSQLRKTFIYFGGNSATPNPFFEFSPSAGKWTAMVIPLASSVPV